jgi:hypothetical protein
MQTDPHHDVPCTQACDTYLACLPRFAPSDCVPCDDCGQPMVPNLSTEDEDGLAWYCINPGCPAAVDQLMEAEAEDLVAIGITRPWAEIIAAALTELGDRLADEEHGTTDDD